MKYHISKLPLEEYSKLSELAQSVKLNEPIDFNCTFLAAKKNKIILGVAGVNLSFNIPKFEHIIVRDKHHKRGLSFRLMKAMEEMLDLSGFKRYAVLVPYTNSMMQEYANKFGFKEYNRNEEGVWSYKDLQGATK